MAGAFLIAKLQWSKGKIIAIMPDACSVERGLWQLLP